MALAFCRTSVSLTVLPSESLSSNGVTFVPTLTLSARATPQLMLSATHSKVDTRLERRSVDAFRTNPVVVTMHLHEHVMILRYHGKCGLRTGNSPGRAAARRIERRPTAARNDVIEAHLAATLVIMVMAGKDHAHGVFLE